MSSAWCIVDDAPVLGGAELFALRLAGVLAERGDTVSVATPATGSLADPVRSAGLTTVALGLPRLKPATSVRWPAGIWQTRRLLSELAENDTIVVANTAGAQAYCAAAAATLGRRVRLVHLVHEQLTADRRSARLVLGRSGAIVANGSNTLAAYEAALGRTDIGKLNNFVDVDAIAAGACPPPAGASGARPVVGVLGRMTPEKGVVEAVEELAQSTASWSRCLIAGPTQDARYAAIVAARIDALGLADRIEVLGPVEVLEFIDRLDVLLVPSTGTEGQPTVVLEGLSRGRPVVIREHMASADFDGLPVVSYRDAATLQVALNGLPEVGAASRSEIARRFGPDQAITTLQAAATRMAPAARK